MKILELDERRAVPSGNAHVFLTRNTFFAAV